MILEKNIESNAFQKLHDFLCLFLRSVEREADKSLETSNFWRAVVLKEFEAGHVMNFFLHTRGKQVGLINYSLRYVFFENKEDEFGQRPNDVIIGFVVHADENSYTITRSISSDLKEYELSDLNFNNEIDECIELEVERMRVMYRSLIGDYINFYKNELTSRLPLRFR